MLPQEQMESCLVIVRGTTEVYRFPFSQIVYIEADENWCNVYTAGPKKNLLNPQSVPLLMKNVWDMIRDQIDNDHAIFKCGRSLLINPEYVRVIDVTKKRLLLADGTNYYELEPSREALIELKTRFK